MPSYGGLPSASHVLNIVRTGLEVCDTALAVSTGNIAGQSALSFKKVFLVGSELPTENIDAVGGQTSDAGTTNPSGIQINTGVYVAATYRSFSQGSPEQTGNPLDVMIDGNGFFQVTLPDGSTAYSRVSALQRNQNGVIVMPKTGYALSPSITIPAEAISVNISEQGLVTYEQAPGGVYQNLGTITLASFVNPNGLKSIGDGMYVPSPASGDATTGNPGSSQFGTIKQGWREGSNVNAVEEITSLLRTEKVHSMLTKAANAASKMWAGTNQMVSA